MKLIKAHTNNFRFSGPVRFSAPLILPDSWSAGNGSGLVELPDQRRLGPCA
jgi:hypothetical protein